MIWPVILCGGSGTRLWPASRTDRPKQFLSLIGDRSSFQNTLLRVTGIRDMADVIVVTGPTLADLVGEQSASVGVKTTVLVEPEARDSAPAIAAAAAYVRQRDPEGVVLMLAADHHIEQVDVFIEAVDHAVSVARDGYIVTFGLHPQHPATGFGYIQPGEQLSEAVRKVTRFVEKPDLATARRYLEDGYLWNSGNFAFLATSLFEALNRFDPATSEGAALAHDRAVETDGRIHLDAESFARTTKISLDFAVMERTDRAAVVSAAFDWSDLGSWSAILQASARDSDGNVTHGDVSLIDTRNVLIRSNGPFVAALGVSDIVVVAEPDAVLVCRLDKDQDVKSVVEDLKTAGRSIANQHAAARRGPATVQTVARAGTAEADLVTLALGGRYSVDEALVAVLSGDVRIDGVRHGEGQSADVTSAEIEADSGPASLLVTRWRRV